MDFQRARTIEQINSRKEEIIKACEEIYREKGYENVNLKAISEMVSCTRPTIYNYFKTKEEIFLEILKRDYMLWGKELKDKFENTEEMTKDEYCSFLTETIYKKERLLELLSIRLINIENESRMERLIDFKKDIAVFSDTFIFGLNKFFPNTSKETKMVFIQCFFTYIYGVYPCVKHTKKQIEAVEMAGLTYIENNFYDICKNGLILLTKNLK